MGSGGEVRERQRSGRERERERERGEEGGAWGSKQRA